MNENKDPTFKFWISGYLSEELTVSEMFLIARSRFSLSLMVAIGLISGSITSADYHLPITILPPFMLVNAVAPPLLIFIAAGLVAGVVRLHHRLMGRRAGKILTIPTAISSTIAFVPAYLFIEYARLLLIGAEMDLTWYVAVVPYLPFIAISEILIGVMFKMQSPSILSKAPAASYIEMPEQASPEDVKTNVEPDVDSDIEQDAAPEPFEPVFIEIGDRRFAASDVVLVEAEGNYVRIVTPQNSFLERASLKEVADRLDQLGMQVHRSIWISYAYVVDHHQAAGQLKITMLGGHEVNVAVRRIKEVENAITRCR